MTGQVLNARCDATLRECYALVFFQERGSQTDPYPVLSSDLVAGARYRSLIVDVEIFEYSGTSSHPDGLWAQLGDTSA